MNVISISIYFLVILVGLLFGLLIGLLILSAFRNRKENRFYEDKMVETLSWKKKMDQKETDFEILEKIEEQESKEDNGEDKNPTPSEDSEKKENILASRVKNCDSYSSLLCDGRVDDETSIVRSRLKMQDEKYQHAKKD